LNKQNYLFSISGFSIFSFPFVVSAHFNFFVFSSSFEFKIFASAPLGYLYDTSIAVVSPCFASILITVGEPTVVPSPTAINLIFNAPCEKTV